jgi:CheY-like chemotaxis protein
MKSILVVDDSAEFRALARGLGESRGAHILEAGDGLIALTILQESQPDLMLLDVQMPSMNGLDFLATLRFAPRLMRPRQICMVTAFHDVQLERDALTLGADEVVDKGAFDRTVLDRLLYAAKATRRSA